MAESNTTRRYCSLRVADVGSLPEKMLAPIEGYENMPLVTLEEAVQPLAGIVPKVKRNVKIVKQNCQQPKDGLTIDQSASIMLYTYESTPHEDSLYVKLNEILRSEQRQNLIPWFRYLRLILTALACLPSECCSVFRGIRNNSSTDYPEGKSFVWWGFSSCTSSVNVLENALFFGKTGKRTLFEIKSITAKDIRKHSFMPGEDELLLLPARKFQVKSCLNCGNELHIVQLIEVTPEYELLEPVPLPDPFNTLQRISQVRYQPTRATVKLKIKPSSGDSKENHEKVKFNLNTKSNGQS
ncbi:unnamed protein product [Rotaria socialis]